LNGDRSELVRKVKATKRTLAEARNESRRYARALYAFRVAGIPPSAHITVSPTLAGRRALRIDGSRAKRQRLGLPRRIK
jgi:hypothetical protein